MIPLAHGASRKYTLRPEVEEQLYEVRHAMASGRLDDRFWRQCEVRRGEDGYLCDETLVYCLRCCRCQQQQRQADRLGEILFGRLGPRIGATLRNKAASLTREQRDDIVQETLALLWPVIEDPSQEFAEAAFERVRFNHTIDALRRLTVGRTMHVESLSEPYAKDEEHDVTLADTLGHDDPALANVEQEIDLLRLLACLPDPRIRRAVHYRALGLPVEDAEHPMRSISGLLGVTPRTIRNYFKTAAQVLAHQKEH